MSNTTTDKPKRVTRKAAPFSAAVVHYAKAHKISDTTKAGKAFRARLRRDARNEKPNKALVTYMGEKQAGDGNHWPPMPASLLKSYLS